MKAITFILLGLITLPSFADIIVDERRFLRLERQVRNISELVLEVENLQEENRQLQGDIAEQRHLFERFKARQKELAQDFDDRLEALTNQPMVAVKTPPVIPTRLPIEKPKNEKGDYKFAYQLLSPKKRQYQKAIQAFEQFISDYPNSKLLANAYYWLGEANYVKQRNDDAFNAFNKVVKSFPKSPKVSGALLKIAYIEIAQGNKKAAKTTLIYILKKYPSSTVARMAKSRLERLNYE